MENERVSVDIADSGKSLDPTLVEKFKTGGLDFDPQDMDNLPEGGMGWFLINSMMDEVHYLSDQGRNVLSLHKWVTSD
jgi:serine/threonine-protein kinase RsbW